MNISSFPNRTKQRVQELDAYLQANVLDTDFVCKHYTKCRASRADLTFFEGQLHHVGRHFDLEVEGKPRRVVIVGQEYGHAPARVSLAERSEIIRASAAKGFRKRSTHSKGTASLLRLLLGREPGFDDEGERLGIGDAHVFEGFALVNALLCSAIAFAKPPPGPNSKGGTKGRSSGVMRRNCAEHFRRSVEILDPTLVILEGQGVRKWLAGSLGIPPKGSVLERGMINNRDLDVLTFNHPSAGGSSAWWGQSPDSQYLQSKVRPAIRDWLEQGDRCSSESPDLAGD